MKKIFFTIALIATTISFAQSLESKIPSTAKIVIAVDGGKLFDLVSLSEFENYEVIQYLIKQVKKQREQVNSIADFGIDINAKAYYFYQPTDSIMYHSGLMKLTDRKAFEKMFDEKETSKIVKKGNINTFVDDEVTLMWNDNIVLFSNGMDSYWYFDANRERFEAQANDDEDFYGIKKRLSSAWNANYAKQLFNYNGASILSNQSYLKSKDNKASATLWIGNYGGMVSDIMKSSFYYAYAMSNSDFMNYNKMGFGSVVAQLYFEEEKARITSKMEIDDKWKKAFQRIYSSKLDRSFFKYFNEDDALAYMSIAMDTEAVLDEYPKLMPEMYGGMLPQYREETSVALDLFSVIVDEEAVGELVTGDMLFILNDIIEKDITYTTYEYDDDYNETEVTKTKKEASPDFTIIVGSENEKLLFKLIRLGVKHEAFETKKNYYKLNLPSKTPFDLFAVIKDEKIFLTTSEKRLTDIVSNRFVAKSGLHKKLIRKNSSVVYMNLDNLISKIPESELSKDEKKFAVYAKDNLKDAYLTGKMKGNVIYSELVLETAKNRKNSLKVLLDFLEFVD
ncbi:MAG TPA: hypothetical protein DDZ39_07895 [Flavobacteriaceae bacterium]|jgi:hypothetical protein|nr:hypothetical protein [Flavobacteriaceae bacterium]HBS12025.1 hypothetical protein [Flavobacteriaceae bacterium]